MKLAFILNEPKEGQTVVDVFEVGDDASSVPVHVHFALNRGKWTFASMIGVATTVAGVESVARISRGIADLPCQMSSSLAISDFAKAIESARGRQVVIAGKELRSVTKVREGEPHWTAVGFPEFTAQAENASVAARRIAAKINDAMEASEDDAERLARWFAKGRKVEEVETAVPFVPVSRFA